MNPKAPLKRSGARTCSSGKPLPRPDIPAKVTGAHVYVHDFTLAGHAARPRDAAARGGRQGARRRRVFGRQPARRARGAHRGFRRGRQPRTSGRRSRGARTQGAAGATARRWSAHERRWSMGARGPFVARGDHRHQGRRRAHRRARRAAPKRSRATYSWPIQSHGSIGPSCAVADVKADRATVWTASQAQPSLRQYLRGDCSSCRATRCALIYLDGAGCYGMNGHDDAAAEAAMLSQAVGKPGAGAMEPRGRTRLGPEGPAAAARSARRRSTPTAASTPGTPRCGCRARRANLRMDSAARAAAAGLAAARPCDRAGLAERRSALCGERVNVRVHWLGRARCARPTSARRARSPTASRSRVSSTSSPPPRAQDPIAFRLRELCRPARASK